VPTYSSLFFWLLLNKLNRRFLWNILSTRDDSSISAKSKIFLGKEAILASCLTQPITFQMCVISMPRHVRALRKTHYCLLFLCVKIKGRFIVPVYISQSPKKNGSAFAPPSLYGFVVFFAYLLTTVSIYSAIWALISSGDL
jgi:hypothetical protein